MLKLLTGAVAAMLLLSSCQTTSIDTALQKNLPKVCSALSTAYVAFAVAATTGNIRQATVDKVENAYAGVVIVCDDPANVTTPDAIIRVTLALTTITTAMKEAQ